MSVYILSGARTPIGSMMGALSSVKSTELGAISIEAAINKAGIGKDKVEEVIMGCVLPAGLGQNPARQAALSAGLPHAVPCSTINKVCGSGLKTIINGIQAIKTEDATVVVAGGMENMSLAPHMLPGFRMGTKFGSSEVKDTMQFDGLWDIYSDRPMGNLAENLGKDFSREQQDEFAINSYKKALKAQEDGSLANEIVPVTIKTRKGEIVVDKDEEPTRVKFDKIPALRPAFDKAGTITAANASSINDGAAALVLAGEQYKDKAKFKIVAYAQASQDPEWFTTAPVEAMKINFEKADLKPEDIDLYEVNEAFSVVSMAAQKEFSIPDDKLNVLGGAVSMGHPIGCSGTRIVVTLMNALELRNAKYGMASICIGGGEALSLIIERM